MEDSGLCRPEGEEAMVVVAVVVVGCWRARWSLVRFLGSVGGFDVLKRVASNGNTFGIKQFIYISRVFMNKRDITTYTFERYFL